MLRTLVLLLAAAPLAAQHAAAERRILLVDLDDVGWDLIASTPTPTLDRLTREGRRFLRFHATPVCSPSRARGLLGAYGSRPELLCGGIVRRDDTYELPLWPFQPLPDLVGDHGFTTVKVGKWHLCPDARTSHPQEAGWDHYTGVMGNARGFDSLEGEGYYFFRKVTDGVVRWSGGEYLTVDETDDALRCVGAGFDLISVSYHAVHRPAHEPPSEFWYEGQPSSREEKVRAALHALDSELGRLVEAAHQSGYTTFVFSDNGSVPLVGGEKVQVTPGGVFVPLWVVGPGIVPGDDHALVDWVDLYATVTDLLGVPRPFPRFQGPDSRSFAHRLSGAPGPTRAWLYAEQWERNGLDPRLGLPPPALWRRSVRTQRWGLVRDDEVAGEHFYDRVADLREERDLLAGELDPPARAALRELARILDDL